MGFLNPLTIGMLLINLALAYYVIRNGRSPAWLVMLALVSFLGFLYTVALWVIFLVAVVIPDFLKSRGVRSFADKVVQTADPGRDYREKMRTVELVGSVDSKRLLAEECVRTGRFADAIALYESAMQGPLGDGDPTLIKGLARAKMLTGDGAGAEALFDRLRQNDPAALDFDAELDYARALVLQGKNDAAIGVYEKIANRYSGEEARARYGLLLESLGQTERAQALFREIVKSVTNAPRYYRARQKEWLALAKSHLK